MLRKMGTSRSFATRNASSPHGYQSTGLSLCCSRYGLVSFPRRFRPLIFALSVPDPSLTITSFRSLFVVFQEFESMRLVERAGRLAARDIGAERHDFDRCARSEEHTSELQSRENLV